MKFKYKFPDILPKKLVDNAFSLCESLGIDEYVWKASDVIEVIELLAQNDFVITHGYAYLFLDKEIDFFGDNWTFKPKNKDEKTIIHNGVRYVTYDFNYVSLDEKEKMINDSVKKAIEYIMNYIRRNGENNCYFSIDFKHI